MKQFFVGLAVVIIIVALSFGVARLVERQPTLAPEITTEH